MLAFCFLALRQHASFFPFPEPLPAIVKPITFVNKDSCYHF
ncbi:Uncharacterised protein [Cedecea neteri]|uniref:Uncharacterized protein n=1 Tax=Cedecea neteri TaxID=158822 RepID=A0A2X2VD80_9ENTR|nr:Uncharacterised protein [Cedecea neteri]